MMNHCIDLGVLYVEIPILRHINMDGKSIRTYGLTNSSGFIRKMAEFQFTSRNQDILPRLIKCKLFFICLSHFIGVLF